MASILASIGDAILARINAASWPFDVVASRTYADIDTQLEQIGTAQIDVMMPDGVDEQGLDSQATEFRVVTFQVGLRKRFDAGDTDNVAGMVKLESLDDCMEAAETLSTLLTADTVTDVPEAKWIATDSELCRRSDLREKKQFTALFDVVFEIHTDRT